jgi:hypothetical protein
MRGLAFWGLMLLSIAPRFGAAGDSGKPGRVPRFAHASLAAYPNAVISSRNPETGMTFYVECDGRRLVALDGGGALAWGIDVFKEANVKPALGVPVVRHLRIDGGSLWATCGKSDSVRIDLLTGRAEFAGRD